MALRGVRIHFTVLLLAMNSQHFLANPHLLNDLDDRDDDSDDLSGDLSAEEAGGMGMMVNCFKFTL